MRNIKPIMDAVTKSMQLYESFGSDYTITTLINPPRITQLEKRYKNKLVFDPSKALGAYIGNAIHHHTEMMLRKVSETDGRYLLERRLFDKILNRRISGKFDILWDKQVMYDIKSASVWKIIFDPDMEHWTQQQNLYAFMLRNENINVKSINVIAIFKDWSKMMSKRDRNYPQDQVVEYRLPLWSPKTQKTFMEERIQLNKDAEKLDDNKLPICTPEERWEQPTKYAVMKKPGAARAARVFETMREAKEYMDKYRKKSKTNANAYIEKRLGERKRCENWCRCNQFCNTYIDYIFEQREVLKNRREVKNGNEKQL